MRRFTFLVFNDNLSLENFKKIIESFFGGYMLMVGKEEKETETFEAYFLPTEDPWTEELLKKIEKAESSEEIIRISLEVLNKMQGEIIILRFLVEGKQEMDLVLLKKMILELQQSGFDVFNTAPLERTICKISKKKGVLYLREFSDYIYLSLEKEFKLVPKNILNMSVSL